MFPHKELRRCASGEKHPVAGLEVLKGHYNPARYYRIEVICARLFILAPLSGRIFAWRVPRVETLG